MILAARSRIRLSDRVLQGRAERVVCQTCASVNSDRPAVSVPGVGGAVSLVTFPLESYETLELPIAVI
jgi:hypothetical protein